MTFKCIRVIDIESGPEPTEDDPGIVELGYCDLISRSADLLGNPEDWDVVGGESTLVNPGRPIPPETSAIHHILDEDLRLAKNWTAAARLFDSHESFQFNAPIIAYAAHGAEFERSRLEKLTGDVPWICTYKVAVRLWPDSPSHSNQCVRYFINPDGLAREMATPTHRAYPDAYVTAFTLREALRMGHAIETLVKWSNEPSLLPRCKIGDYRNDGKGTPWADVEDSMLYWIVRKMSGDPRRVDDVHTARHHLEQREIDRRLTAEQNDLDRQYASNGIPTGEPQMQELPPLSAYENQKDLPL